MKNCILRRHQSMTTKPRLVWSASVHQRKMHISFEQFCKASHFVWHNCTRAPWTRRISPFRSFGECAADVSEQYLFIKFFPFVQSGWRCLEEWFHLPITGRFNEIESGTCPRLWAQCFGCRISGWIKHRCSTNLRNILPCNLHLIATCFIRRNLEEPRGASESTSSRSNIRAKPGPPWNVHGKNEVVGKSCRSIHRLVQPHRQLDASKASKIIR